MAGESTGSGVAGEGASLYVTVTSAAPLTSRVPLAGLAEMSRNGTGLATVRAEAVEPAVPCPLFGCPPLVAATTAPAVPAPTAIIAAEPHAAVFREMLRTVFPPIPFAPQREELPAAGMTTQRNA